VSSARTGAATHTAVADARPDGAAAPSNRLWPVAARYLPIAIPAVTMVILGAWGLPRQNAMGNDEIVTRYAASLGFGQLFHLIEHTDVYHATYYVIMHFWEQVFGVTPTIIRIPSVIAMTIGVALVAYIGRRLSGSGWTGLFAGMIMALTPEISFYAQTAREYPAVIVCVLGSTLALVRALEAEAVSEPGGRITRRWVPYVLLVALGGYLNEISLSVLVAHLVTVLLARRGRRVLTHWFVAGAVGAILVLPVVAVSIHQDAAASWITRPDFHDLGILFHDYFGSANAAAVLLFACALVAVFSAGAWWRRSEISLQSVAAPLLVMPGGTVFLESVIGHPLYVDRYVLFGETGAALLAGAGVARIGQWLGRRWGSGGARRWGSGGAPWRRRGGERLGQAAGRRVLAATSLVTGAAVCLAVLLLQLTAQHRARTPLTREFDYGTPSAYVGARARPGDGILFFNSFYRKATLGYPRDFRYTKDFAMSVSPATSGTLNGFDKPYSVVGPLMLTYQRIWVFGRAPSAHVTKPSIRAESELLLSRYHLIAERHFKGVVVTLWQLPGP
jgi:mannosyltransferase